MGRLADLFGPERVAVIGASDEQGSVGRAITENLLADYTGEVVAVNPSADDVLGLAAYDAIEDVEEPVDVAVVVVPPDGAVAVIREAGEGASRTWS
jgi:acetyltransferase